MTGRLEQIWRHPIKAHGFEALEASDVKAGETLPWDRVWAVTHEATKATGGAWAHCANFSRGAKAPNLMAIAARLDTTGETLTFSHPTADDLTRQIIASAKRQDGNLSTRQGESWKQSKRATESAREDIEQTE